ncbi:MAG: alpha/beta fold hydrolase, partial [Chloroflexota bacterium]
IFRSAEAERHITELYDGLVADWPVAVDDVDVDSTWGRVHVLAWGPAKGPPVLLCHAASMAATSWLPNAAALAEAGVRCHAVDYLGEANKSRLADRDRYPKSGPELGELYASIMDALDIDRCPVVGASAGGHVALRLTLTAPERVERLVLAGPMGITPLSPGTMLRMMLASVLPRPFVTERTSRWALGTAPSVTERYGGWFAAVLAAVASPPRVARPVALDQAELARITVPVLLILGSRDPLVGDAGRAAQRASALPDLSVETLESSHLVAVEQADRVNELLVDFLGHAPAAARAE